MNHCNGSSHLHSSVSRSQRMRFCGLMPASCAASLNRGKARRRLDHLQTHGITRSTARMIRELDTVLPIAERCLYQRLTDLGGTRVASKASLTISADSSVDVFHRLAVAATLVTHGCAWV